MNYAHNGEGIVMWHDTLMLPMKKKSPLDAQKYFKKEVSFDEAPTYWFYTKEEDCWNLYYIRRGRDKRMAAYNIGEYTPEAILAKLADKDITAHDCDIMETCKTRFVGPRTELAPVIWSNDFNGKSVMSLVLLKPKMTFNEILNVIRNEGGTVDACGIVHKAD